MYRLLAMCCLLGVALAQPLEDQKEQVTALENTARTLTARADDGGSNNASPIAQIAVTVAASLAVIYVAYVLVDDFLFLDLLPDVDFGRSFLARRMAEELADDEGMFTTLLNSIDPVDMSFRFMEINNTACRKRTLCELSAAPVIGQLVRYISPSVNSMKEYQEAMSAGEALEDCALLFAECAENQYFVRK